MIRHAAVVGLAFVGLSFHPAFAQPTEWDQAWQFREQIGLAPTDLAALDIDAEDQEALAEAVRDYFADPEHSALALDEFLEARRELVSDVSRGRDPEQAFDRVSTKRAALIQALQSLASTLRDEMPVELRPYVVHAITNTGIDSPYRLLDLTIQQRTQILALQEQRDRVTNDARQSTRKARVNAAQSTFEAGVRASLTESQRTELAGFNANIAANLVDVWQVELADFPTEPVATGKLDFPALAKQFLASTKTLLANARTTLTRFATWLAAYESATSPTRSVATAAPDAPELGG
jgi:hypothetical protein